MGRNLSARLRDVPPPPGGPTPPRRPGPAYTPAQEDPFWRGVFLTMITCIIVVTGFRVVQMLQSAESLYGVSQVKRPPGTVTLNAAQTPALSGQPGCVVVSSGGQAYFVVRSFDGFKAWETTTKARRALKFDAEKQVFYDRRRPQLTYSPANGKPNDTGNTDEMMSRIFSATNSEITINP